MGQYRFKHVRPADEIYETERAIREWERTRNECRCSKPVLGSVHMGLRTCRRCGLAMATKQ